MPSIRLFRSFRLQLRACVRMHSNATALLLALLASNAAALEAPPNWNAQARDGAEVFTPGDLQETEILYVTVLPYAPLDGESLEGWAKQFAGGDAPPVGGKWSAALALVPKAAQLVTATREWTDANGKRGVVMYTATSLDGESARITRLTANVSPALKRHSDAAQALMSAAATEKSGAPATSAARKPAPAKPEPTAQPTPPSEDEAPTAQSPSDEPPARGADKGAVKVEALPPPVAGIKPGGPLVPGLYSGNYVADRKRVLYRLDIMLYANGEYEFIGHRDKAGEIRYSAATGKLDLKDPLWNNIYHPQRDFCIYGRDEKGEPAIYAQDLACCGGYRIELRRVGDVDRDPPKVAKQKKEAARAEAARYKFVTEPGKGIAAKDIEAIAYRWEQVSVVGGLELRYHTYLLLKDGTVHNGLPVPPEDMNVADSKKYDAKAWGRWRRSGSSYEFAWGDGDSFKPMNRLSVVTPAQANQRLQGTWGTSWSVSIGGGGSWSFWGVTLNPDGRFEKYRRGGHGATNPSAEVAAGVVYDDEGASSTVSAPNVGGGSSSKSNKTKLDRSGTYTLKGYTMELRYGNGQVVRLPFFLAGKDDPSIWFEGTMLTREKAEKK